MNLLFAARGKFDENNFDNFSWEKYKDWSKIYQLDELVSLDGMLNEDLIEPDYDNEEDWNNIHVVDLAKGHVKAVDKILKTTGGDCYNLGTGNGYSVLELVNTFMNVNKVDVKYEIKERRPGDIDACYADPSYAYEKLGWKAEKDINEMCLDAYNFVKKE